MYYDISYDISDILVRNRILWIPYFIVATNAMTLEQWNGVSWNTLDTCDGSCQYGTPTSISNTATFRLLRNSAFDNYLSFDVSSANSYDNLAVFIRNNAVANSSVYDSSQTGQTPLFFTGECDSDVYLFIENKNAIENAQSTFDFSLIDCSPTSSSSGATTVSPTSASTGASSASTSATATSAGTTGNSNGAALIGISISLPLIMALVALA